MSYMVETVVGMCGCACMLMISLMFFFFKQKTAYELRISDWSSDVCSSDLVPADRLIDPSEAATHPSPVASRYPGLYRIVVDEKPTLRELLRTRATSSGHQVVEGTAPTVAHRMQDWFRSGAWDGFTQIGRGSCRERV